MSRSSLLRKLCFSLGIPNEIDILTIEGLAILPLLHKQNHPNNIKLGWFLSTHWWTLIRYTSENRICIIESIDNDWKQNRINFSMCAVALRYSKSSTFGIMVGKRC